MSVAYVDDTHESFKGACSLGSSLEYARRQLKESDHPLDRIAAVRTLAEFGGDLSTASLVAALFDDDARVREAAIEALDEIGDPAISSECLEVLFSSKSQSAKSTRPTESVAEPTEAANVSQEEKLARLVEEFDNSSPAVRNAAVFSILSLEPANPASLFERIMESSSEERRCRISEALTESGLVAEAIDSLGNGDRVRVQAALSFLCLMTRLEVMQPLTAAIEHHTSPQIRRALIKVLTLNGQADVAASAAKRRLGIDQTPSIYTSL